MTYSPADVAELALVEHELDKRWPETKIEPSLTRIAALMDLLGSPQRAYPTIHVAGTNGKGSTCAFLRAAIEALRPHTRGKLIALFGAVGRFLGLALGGLLGGLFGAFTYIDVAVYRDPAAASDSKETK